MNNVLIFGTQFKFFGARQVYEIVNDFDGYKKVVPGQPHQKVFVLTDVEKQNIRSIYDPIKNRQIAKRKIRGGKLTWLYQKQ